MITIAKRGLLNYLKNPIIYLGAIFVFLSTYLSVSPYLNIHYFSENSEIKILETHSEVANADIMDGYIPTTEDEQYNMGFEQIQENLISGFNMTSEEANSLVNEMKNNNMSILDVADYLEGNYFYRSAEYDFYDHEMKKATNEEANNYINSALSKNLFSYYFSYKFVDYFGLSLIIYAIIIFAFLLKRETKEDIYELLHTKPIRSWQYIGGKIIAGMLTIDLVVLLISTIFNILVVLYSNKVGLQINILDIYLSVLFFIIPNLFMVLSVYLGVAILFKNPLPALPALVLYLIYSNMGSKVINGKYIYSTPTLAILIRFPDKFFETKTSLAIIYNQIFLIIIACIIVVLSTVIWKRRRIY